MSRPRAFAAGMGVLLLLDCGATQPARGSPCTQGQTIELRCDDGSPGVEACLADGGWTTTCTSSAGAVDAGAADAGAIGPGDEDGGSVPADGGPAPTFTFINQNIILGESCGNCHGQDAGPGEAGLDLVTDPYSALVGVPAVNLNGSVHEQADGGPLLRVAPGDPSESLLYIKLGLASASSQWGQPMPMSGPQSTPVYLMNALRDWIAAGAPNN